MIKLTTAEILEIDNGLARFSNLHEQFFDKFDLPFELSYKVSRIRKRLKEIIEKHKEENNNLIKTLGTLNVETGKYEFGDNIDKYESRIRVLLSSIHEVSDVNEDTFKVSELKKYQIPANILYQIFPILLDDSKPKNDKKVEHVNSILQED